MTEFRLSLQMTFEEALKKTARWANQNRRLLHWRPVIQLLHLRRAIQRLAQRYRALRVLLAILAVVTRNDAQQMIAGVAYYGVLCLLPISFGVFQALEMVLGSSRTQHWFIQLSSELLPPQIDLITLLSSGDSTAAGVTAILAGVGLSWGSIRLFGAVGLVVNRMWDIQPTQLGGIARLRQFLFMSATAMILLISSLLTYLVDLQSLPELLRDLRVLESSEAVYAQRWWPDLLSIVLSTGAFLLVYRYVPERSVQWKWAVIAGAVAGVAFKLANDGFALFLAHLAPSHLLYGPLASVLVFLMWMFASALILAIGAALNAYTQSIYAGQGPTPGPGWFLRQ